MMDPAAEVHRGFAPMMPSYLGLLSATEAASLVELIRGLAGASTERPMPLPRSTGSPVVLPTQQGDAHASQLELAPEPALRGWP